MRSASLTTATRHARSTVPRPNRRTVSANEVANTLSVAFGAAVVEHGGGVAYEPTKADLENYFGPLARAKDSKGWLAGVPYGPRAKERPLRLLYLAPRVVALLRASRGALDPLVDEAYDVAIGADNKAHASAQKSVLKVQYASLVERITAVEMDADDAREAELRPVGPSLHFVSLHPAWVSCRAPESPRH